MAHNEFVIDSACRAVLFNLDGVFTDTAIQHARAWKETLDPFLIANNCLPRFDLVGDYANCFAGRERSEGLRSFLGSRGRRAATLAVDETHFQSLCDQKNKLYQKYIKQNPIHVFEDSIELANRAKRLGIRLALVTASQNAYLILESTDLVNYFDLIVDGKTVRDVGLQPKPAADAFEHAARGLGVQYSECLVVEDSAPVLRAAAERGPWAVLGVLRNSSYEDRRRRFGSWPSVSDLSTVRFYEGK